MANGSILSTFLPTCPPPCTQMSQLNMDSAQKASSTEHVHTHVSVYILKGLYKWWITLDRCKENDLLLEASGLLWNAVIGCSALGEVTSTRSSFPLYPFPAFRWRGQGWCLMKYLVNGWRRAEQPLPRVSTPVHGVDFSQMSSQRPSSAHLNSANGVDVGCNLDKIDTETHDSKLELSFHSIIFKT